MKLFEPGKIGKLNIKNRIVMAPMGVGGMARSDGTLSKQGINYYIARAKGGVGLIITGLCRVDRKIEALSISPFVPELTVDNKIFVNWIDELTNVAHDYGVKVALQLSAGEGRILTKQYDIGLPAAPSSIPWFRDPNVMTRELTLFEIEHLIKSFRFAAEVIGNTGIDAIELHCHGGYLFDQFLTSLWNKRDDHYGGNLDGRMKFLFEIVLNIKNVLGSDFPIIVEYGLTHYFPGGREIEEGLEIARRLEGAGVDALSIDAGCSETVHWVIPSQFQPPGCSTNLVELVKNVVNIPLIVSGKLGYPKLAEEVLQYGKADFIAIGRALLADPQWPNKVKEGRYEDICPCIGCLEGCRRRIHEGKVLSCAVNPSTGHEKELKVHLADKKKSVVVIGGGPGGMEAARISALRGHFVTLFEKADELGGSLIPASVPSFKQDYRQLIQYLTLQIRKLGVNIVLRKEVTADLIKSLNPEVVFIATGSTINIPNIQGIKNHNVANVIDMLLGRKRFGKSIVIIGGGTIGCEFALHIAKEYKNVSIVEISEELARNMYYVNRMHLLKLLDEAGIKILTKHEVIEIKNDKVIVKDQFNKIKTIGADTVAIAAGVIPNNELKPMITSIVSEVYLIGDCREPRNVMNAIWDGYRTARVI